VEISGGFSFEALGIMGSRGFSKHGKCRLLVEEGSRVKDTKFDTITAMRQLKVAVLGVGVSGGQWSGTKRLSMMALVARICCSNLHRSI